MPIVKAQSAAVDVGGVFTANICEAKLLNLMTLRGAAVLTQFRFLYCFGSSQWMFN
jgi:hypothetical protein